MQSAGLRALQAKPAPAVHRKLCPKVLGRGQVARQMRRRNTGLVIPPQLKDSNVILAS